MTIVTRNRECLFGEIADGEMRLNELGRALEDEWLKTAGIRQNIQLDYFVVMPNHFHGILFIMDSVGASRRLAPTTAQPRAPAPNSLGAIMAQFKSAVTKCINEIRGTQGAPVWQRNYGACPERMRREHVIRNEKDLERIREYIVNNLANWQLDQENPKTLETSKPNVR